MILQYTPRFKKQYKKLPTKFQQQFDERLKIFVQDPTNPILRVHPLKGQHRGYWSMNVSGDLRAIYLNKGDELVIFAFIGTHSHLYG